jgi:hypothetical protein
MALEALDTHGTSSVDAVGEMTRRMSARLLSERVLLRILAARERRTPLMLIVPVTFLPIVDVAPLLIVLIIVVLAAGFVTRLLLDEWI